MAAELEQRKNTRPLRKNTLQRGSVTSKKKKKETCESIRERELVSVVHTRRKRLHRENSLLLSVEFE